MKKLSLNDYKIKESSRKHKRAVEKTFTYSLKDGKTFDVNQIEYLYSDIVKDLKKNNLTNQASVLITAGTGLNKMFTIKGFKEKQLHLENYDDYFEESVKDTSKFKQIANVSITVSLDVPADNRPSAVNASAKKSKPATKKEPIDKFMF
jgi:hypothetical protein